MNILGYIIYGVGTLIIIAFLWSAVRRQQKESREEFLEDEYIPTTPQTTETEEPEAVETAEEPLIQPEVLAGTRAEPLYENGPEVETKQEPSIGLTREIPIQAEGFTAAESDINVDFVPEETQFESAPSAPSFTIEKDEPVINYDGGEVHPTEDQVRESFEARTGAESAVGGDNIVDEDVPSHIVSINIVAKRGHAFRGLDLLTAFERQNLVLNEREIYQYQGSAGQALFYIASQSKPGTFDVNALDRFKTQGLTVFIDLATISEPKQTFQKMLSVAYEISNELNGDLLDHRRQRLTESSVVEYLAQIKGIEAVRPAGAI